jgi:hypothetical protein
LKHFLEHSFRLRRSIQDYKSHDTLCRSDNRLPVEPELALKTKMPSVEVKAVSSLVWVV